GLGLVRSPPVVGDARRRQAPCIAYVRIKVDGLVGVWQVLGLRVDRGITREVFGEEVAIRRAPSRDAGRRVHTDGGADRAGLQVGGRNADLRAPDEALAGVVEIVGVEVVESMPLRARPKVDSSRGSTTWHRYGSRTPDKSRSRCTPAALDTPAKGSRAASKTGDSPASGPHLRRAGPPDPRTKAAADSRGGAALRTG